MISIKKIPKRTMECLLMNRDLKKTAQEEKKDVLTRSAIRELPPFF